MGPSLASALHSPAEAVQLGKDIKLLGGIYTLG